MLSFICQRNLKHPVPDFNVAVSLFVTGIPPLRSAPLLTLLVLQVVNLSKSDSLKQTETFELAEMKQNVAHRPVFKL